MLFPIRGKKLIKVFLLGALGSFKEVLQPFKFINLVLFAAGHEVLTQSRPSGQGIVVDGSSHRTLEPVAVLVFLQAFVPPVQNGSGVFLSFLRAFLPVQFPVSYLLFQRTELWHFVQYIVGLFLIILACMDKITSCMGIRDNRGKLTES